MRRPVRCHILGLMATKRVRNTAFGVAMVRGLEQRVPPGPRLFDDPVAERFLTGLPALVVRNGAVRRAFLPMMERGAPGFYGGVVCRTRAIDDACRAALAAGATQVLLLGAGMDTRPYRMDETRAAAVWELDLPEVQAAKRAAVDRVLGGPPPHVRFAPVDLTTQDLAGTLAANGFDPAARTLLVWEAVSQYLPRASVEDVFAFAGTLAAGSRVVFTYLPQRVFDEARFARWVRRYQWQTGFDPIRLGAHLATHGLTLVEDLGGDEYQERYLRPLGRELAVFEIERVAVAVREAA